MKIAIASGKGGTGKTTLATNLASFLSEKEEVLLVDIDVEEPNSGLFLQGELVNKVDNYKMIPKWEKENCIHCGKCAKICNFNAVLHITNRVMIFPELCHSCFACSDLCPTKSLPMIAQKMGKTEEYAISKSLSFIESRLNIGQEQAVPLISQAKRYVKEHFPPNKLIIFDSPPGTSCPMIEATQDANFVILITEPTPFGFHDLGLAVETMRKIKSKFGVVINKYGIGNDEVERYCENENIPVLAKIPHSREIAELYAVGKLFYQISDEYRAILASLINKIFSLCEVKK